MLESRSYYHPFGETGNSPYKWCVKLVVCGCDRGIIGIPTKKAAQEWLDRTLQQHAEGQYFSNYPIIETAVYYAKSTRRL